MLKLEILFQYSNENWWKMVKKKIIEDCILTGGAFYIGNVFIIFSSISLKYYNVKSAKSFANNHQKQQNGYTDNWSKN